MKYQFFIQSLGCKVNQYDSASLAADLNSLGFQLSIKNPDLVILNTCTVTKNAITKDRQQFNLLKRKYPQAKFVVMGCWPQTSDKELATFDNDGVFWWGVGRRKEFLEFVKTLFSLKVEALPVKNNLALTEDLSRYFLKVGDGCNQFCAYCLIPYARGPIKSRPMKELALEVERALKQGMEEIVLTGIHLGRYGQDFADGKTSLNNLLRVLLKLPKLGRIRLSSIEINEVDDELIALMKDNPKICRHLHISLQAGCDKILQLMRRPYDAKYFQNRVLAIRKLLPEISLTTDIIVGFPGETKNDFLVTKKFAAKIGFSKIHVFPFSAHEKTLAFSMPKQVEIFERKKRAQELRELSRKLEADYRQKILNLFKGKNISVVLEALIGEKARLKTEYHFDFLLPLKNIEMDVKRAEEKIGQILEIKID
jgi:threonylcarbamoyladenosine tRNA methylthiotransferase MtaB